MTTFNGPWAKDLHAFTKSVSSMPAKYKTAFDKISEDSRTVICNASYLHVWETDSDLDNLVHLIGAIAKPRTFATLVPQADGTVKNVSIGMVLIAEVNSVRDNFTRVCEFVHHLTSEDGKSHLDKTVMAFGNFVIVKGVDNAMTPGPDGTYSKETRRSLDSAVKRTNIAIERVFKKCGYSEKKIVWHHGPVVHFLNHWIRASDLRSSLAAVTVHSALTITPSSIHPSQLGRTNNLHDLQRLEEYCKKLGIFAVFLDNASQSITEPHLQIYAYYWALYMHMFIPYSVTRPHYHVALDSLVTFCFRLRGACDKKYGAATVDLVKSKLTPSKAKPWARQCISASTYTKPLCQSAARDQEIYNAVYLADIPFARFAFDITTPNMPLYALSRLTIGPSALDISKSYTCAPVALSFGTLQLRASAPSPLRLWLPNPGNDYDKVTKRIQGIMQGATTVIYQEKGAPTVSSEAVEVWEEVMNACTWALDGCKGKLPAGVEDKLKHVDDCLKRGMWSYLFWGYDKQ